MATFTPAYDGGNNKSGASLSSSGNIELPSSGEEAWIEVIQKMDEMYAELVESQISLEKKHEELNRAHMRLNQTQEHLVQSEKMAALGRLVAGVAHELNNPISYVYGNMHALKDYGAKITEYLNHIDDVLGHEQFREIKEKLNIDRITSDISPLVDGTLEGAERISEIVKELRQFSGTQKQKKEEFFVQPIIETAVNWVQRAAKDNVNIRVEYGTKIKVYSRSGYVHQIIVNLLQNAIDAVSENADGLVQVRCRIEKEKLCVCVHDNGVGISSADMNNIFEPFYTTKPIGQGTGLGLYVSYNMAKELGGDLSVETPPMGGTLFKLMLPVRAMNA